MRAYLEPDPYGPRGCAARRTAGHHSARDRNPRTRRIGAGEPSAERGPTVRETHHLLFRGHGVHANDSIVARGGALTGRAVVRCGDAGGPRRITRRVPRIRWALTPIWRRLSQAPFAHWVCFAAPVCTSLAPLAPQASASARASYMTFA